MKIQRLFLLLPTIFLMLSFSTLTYSIDKVTSISEDFEDGQISGRWQPESDAVYTLTNVDDDGNKVLKIYVDKNSENSAGFDAIRFTVEELMDLSANPYVSFKVKTDTEFPLQINLMEENDVNLHHTLIENTIAGDGNWVQLYLDFSSLLADTNRIDSIKTLLINFNTGWQQFYTGTVWLDDFKVGEAAAPILDKVTSITEDFEDGQISSRWQPESDAVYTLTNVDDDGNKVLKIDVDKNSENSAGFDAIRFTVEELMDLSANPYVSFKVKTDTEFPLQINLMEENDINLHHTLIENTIAGDGNWVQLYLDFSSLLADTNRIDSIKTLLINFNTGWQQFYTGTVWIDDFKVGEAAEEIQIDNINNINKIANLICYPNPAYDFINIKASENIDRIEILSINGKKQKSECSAYNQHKINVANLNSGLYLINVYDKSGHINSSKFMKK